MGPGFWHDRRVFVTGHTGFKGGWLSLWLTAQGARVSGYSLAPPTSPNLFELAEVQGCLAQSDIADILDIESLRKRLLKSEAEVVFHLAAQSLVRESYVAPVQTYATNVMGTAHVLDACRQQSSVKVVVVVTSDKCYDNREWVWPYREIDPLGGHDPYSSSKGCAELVTAAYGRSFFDKPGSHCSITSVRAGNVIGGGDWAKDRLVVDLIAGLSTGERIVIRNPSAIRPWQHVLEPLSGYLAVAEKLWTQGQSPWEAWNFGPSSGEERTVKEIAELISGLWGREDLVVMGSTAGHPHEAKLLALDSSKARTVLGWRPRLTFQEGVSLTVEWFKKYLAGESMRDVTLAQIAIFERRGLGAVDG